MYHTRAPRQPSDRTDRRERTHPRRPTPPPDPDPDPEPPCPTLYEAVRGDAVARRASYLFVALVATLTVARVAGLI